MVKVRVKNMDYFEGVVRLFRRKTQREGILSEARERREYEKPCEKAKRKAKESLRRIRRKRRQGN